MKIKSKTAFRIGISSFFLVLLMHTLYSFSGSGESVSYFLTSALLFILPSLIIPILFLIFKHPLIAFGGVIPILPWLLLAYYADHIMPYQGGGASIMYVAVVFWGFRLH
ncbi:hypothetical protein N9D02_08700 [Emcibacteraceae bacterium]|nr:hypothetical protein [Emcibacteraceae bacterium]